MLFGPKLSQPKNILTVMVLISAGQFFKAVIILFAIGKALLFQGKGLLCILILEDLEHRLFGNEFIVIEDEIQILL